MLNENDFENIEAIIKRSRGGFSNINNESYSYNNFSKKESPEITILKEAMDKKYFYVCDKLGIDKKYSNIGLNILNGIISIKEDSIDINYSKYDTIESAMMKLTIKNEASIHKEEAEKKKKFDLDDSFTEYELSKVNNSVDKITTKKLDENIVKNVADATSQFISDRNERTDMIKQAYQDVIDKNKTSNDIESNDQIQAAEESYKRIIHKDKQRTTTLYESIVIAVGNQFKDENKRKYISDESGRLDIDKVLDISSAIYGAMETINQYNIINIDESVIKYVINAIYE